MATPRINENCHYVQNDPHTCKIKLEKFHFNILCRFGVIKECLPGGGGRIRHLHQGKIGLSFSLVAEALTGLIYHRPLEENSSFQFSSDVWKSV